MLSNEYGEKTLKALDERAEQRMQSRSFSRKSDNINDYRTPHEDYLLRPTEVFARLFEAFMLSLDKQRGESLSYRLDFPEEEIDKVKPLLLAYLNQIHADYLTEMATS